jgi:hypothetical protein
VFARGAGANGPGNRYGSESQPVTNYRSPTLRGVQIQRVFGSQRALKTIEDFTQFEQAGG